MNDIQGRATFLSASEQNHEGVAEMSRGQTPRHLARRGCRLDAEMGEDVGTVEASMTGVYPYARVDLNVGLGAGRGVLTPYAGMTLGDRSSRTMRTGANWQFGPDVAVGLEAARSESEDAESTNNVRLRATVRFQALRTREDMSMSENECSTQT